MFQPILLAAVFLCVTAAQPVSPAPQQQPAAQPSLQQAQEPELLQQGREDYRKGEFERALTSLRQVTEIATLPAYRALAWYYLGRCYYQLGRYEEALGTYRQALAEDPSLALARYELGKVFLAQKNYEQAAAQHTQLKTIGQTLREEAKRRAEAYAKDPPAQQKIEVDTVLLVSTANSTQTAADELAVYLADLFPPEEAARYQIPLVPPVPSAAPKSASAPAEALPSMGKDGVGRPTILYREKARYTEPARYNYVQGVVVLSVVFSVAGELKDIRVLRSLPDGLTRKAIEAALKIRFQPATKDGAPVSVRGNLEYSFNLY